ncbi:uncharacterized protein [Onthophagus taurus]|uniref:uncharacterized protein n=1 Tax=Onthophagus taurus TaxID=166361 RepID=UPI000C20270F|nr:uncharacterized protein LOC111414896 [Onthophagus taurus]
MDKKSKKHSKSLEEISKIPPQQAQLTRAHATRHSLQTVSKLEETPPLRHTRSQIYGKPRKQHTTIILDDRIEEEEDSTTEPVITNPVSDIRSSQISKKSHRSRSGSASTSRSRKESSTHDNKAFESSLDNISVISGRSAADVKSYRSSSRTPSVSLSVQQEQYCCKSKWTPCEKRLTALVAVLLTVILILLISVIVLSTANK